MHTVIIGLNAVIHSLYINMMLLVLLPYCLSCAATYFWQGCIRFPKLASKRTCNNVITLLNRTHHQVHIFLKPLLQQEKIAAPLLIWIHRRGEMRFGRFPDMCERVSVFNTGGNATLCVAARKVVSHSRVQLPLSYRYW